ncbi:cellulose binding domain-containing protein [Microtetraspora niveoalba]|uniref:cellulose binding domain-containing protein n=1 Tax=Microtetraspora niveoalba TaxID=46175 RepID=UPI001FDF9FA4|nr:cellulose binding domain-containing protein [Microtetraspora niveoalba]
MRLTNSWPGGFQGEVTIENTGSSVLNGWYVQWTLPSGAKITQAWNGTSMQSGPTAMIHAESWNSALAAGATATAGFLGTSASTPTFTDVSCG